MSSSFRAAPPGGKPPGPAPATPPGVNSAPPPTSSSFRSESATQPGVSRESIHSASPLSLCLKSGARGFRFVVRLSQYSEGWAKNSAHFFRHTK